MQQNRALSITAYGGPEVVQIRHVPVPEPKAGQVLVRVHAAGINGLDWKVRAGYLRDAFPLHLPAVLGIELAGTVVAAGPDTSRFAAGDRVMGSLSALGAYADYVAVDEANLCRTPQSLTDVGAAALPVATQTAWQSLHAAGDVRAVQRILIHGAAGGVGGFCVQFAKAAGATVFATASGQSRDHVSELGADTVIDYRTQRFEDCASDIDLVIDLVGGDTLDRSWQVLAPGGAIVSTASPDVVARAPEGRRGVWVMMKPDSRQLQQFADAVSTKVLRSTVAEVTDLNGLPAAIERNRTGHAAGKMVVDLTR